MAKTLGAVVALHRTDPEFRFFLVHATDGEGGSIAEGSGATVSYTHLTPVSYTHLTLPTTPYV